MGLEKKRDKKGLKSEEKGKSPEIFINLFYWLMFIQYGLKYLEYIFVL